MTTSGREVDVCVFGAGPAGVATALRLSHAGVSVAILDRPAGDPPWLGETLSNAIAAPLRELGLWERFSAAGHLRGYEIRSIWGDAVLRGQNALYDPIGARWHVDRARFDRDLREIATHRGCAIRTYARLDDVRRDARAWQIALDGTHGAIRARFLVDATGRRCALGRRLGARHRRFDDLVAIVAHTARNERPAYAGAIVVEAVPGGWWYASPLPGGHAIAYLTDRDLAPHDAPNGAGLRVVAADSRLIAPGPQPHWLAVGDAYAAHDPLFGFGVTRALRGGIAAADAIHAFLDAGDDAPLRAYHAARRAEFHAYLDGLATRYSSERRWPASTFWARRSRAFAATA